MSSILTIEGSRFLRSGQPHRILSGAVHYFRVVPEYWEDRLLKCRACGLNTVETYIPWNLHEPAPGSYCFEGMLDIRKFLTLARKTGLDVIIRPGPYICAEWDFGGLPAWLLKDPGMRVRTMHPGYLGAVERYFARLLPELLPFQGSLGGGIVAMQVENEYGSYGNNSEYLRWLATTLVGLGVTELLFTSDGPEDAMLQGGTLREVFKTANLGSEAGPSFEKLRHYQPEGPLMCMEFWNGWFDHWGTSHHTRDAADAAATLEEILSRGGSVNIYMMHGGTNFGFLNGANHDGAYRCTTTSYDFDAPLDEAGRPTQKFFAFQDVLARHGGVTGDLPPPVPTAAYGGVKITGALDFFRALPDISRPTCSDSTRTMEEIGQNFGFILYRTRISGPRPESRLFVQDVHDRALVFQDGRRVGMLDRNEAQAGLLIAIPEAGSQLDILVENLGRVNYGPELHDRKGITMGVRLNYQFLSNWEIYPLELNSLPTLPWEPASESLPAFFQGTFQVDSPQDTFLQVDGTHGIAWINGFCLGRYWKIGPQRTLYLPAPLLTAGCNQIVLFEFEGTKAPSIELLNHPILG